ncbi:alanine--tRNA ligase [Patescibacteria group bacterium]|nr:alanine--tRNA ligase [Patescibacteria group bacterium]
MTHLELRDKFLAFWKDRGHGVIPSASLVPENDPSVLFITAGMHPLVPYLLGQPHPSGKRLVDVQKVIRTDDIDEVGDPIHHTFFEMLGNWSLGDYFKKEAIEWSYEFLTKDLKLDPNNLTITCFTGDKDAPKDEFSAKVWESLGIPKDRIKFLGKKDNWWGPAGETGPCGPDTEMHYKMNSGEFSEIWNNVFMEYNKTTDGKFEKLKQQNVDTGMGLERTLAVVNGFDDDYLTELWMPVIERLEQLSGKKYKQNLRSFRIIADHIRASVFAISDSVLPSNKQQGYILRRLIRRSVVQAKQLGINPESLNEIASIFIEIMSGVYPDLVSNREMISKVLLEEIQRFEKTLDKGLREFEKINTITGRDAFNLFQTFGFPWELTAELANQKGQKVDQEEFKNEFQKHQELSRTASAGMFRGGLVDHSETVTRYHSATHLLQAALRQVLGEHVHQEGSNLTSERLRFDFSHPQKLTPEEIKRVEDIVNEQIAKGLEQKKEILTYDESIKSGALAFFKERYPEKVTVYSFGNFSKEICGGPHVANTKEIGRFKIIKEEAVSAGIRRIYAKI